MSGNTFGKLFTVTTFGESHGSAIGCVVDGCPPGVKISETDIQQDLDRRRPGRSRFTSQRQEPDRVKILSGVFEGKTTGTPIGMIIENVDHKSKDYADIEHRFRPGHGDFSHYHKYGIYDYRGGGRGSARETAMRVAAGSIAKKYLASVGITITGYISQLGPIRYEQFALDEIEQNPFFFPDKSKLPELEQLITKLRREGDSIGAKVSVLATGLPIGLGEPVFDKLDADIAHALMSIGAVKGVEIGSGFSCVEQLGSEHRDEITPQGFLSNNAGGILGGISSGQDIHINIALKPTSSIRIPATSVDVNNQPVSIVTTGRHDPCVGIRAVPVAEAMLSLVLVDHLLRDRAQNWHNRR